MTDDRADDELRALLHGADPAASLPPADPRRVADLLEDAVSTTRPTPAAAPADDAEPLSRHRRPRPFAVALAAAAAAVVVAAVAVPVVRSLDGPAVPEVTTTLTASGAGGAAMDCPTVAQVLPSTDTAFRGRAVQVDADRVVLAVDQVYRGDPGEGVALTADLQETGTTVGGFPFQVGQEYLVSAIQGTVAVCGGSGPVTPELQAEYDRAFG